MFLPGTFGFQAWAMVEAGLHRALASYVMNRFQRTQKSRTSVTQSVAYVGSDFPQEVAWTYGITEDIGQNSVGGAPSLDHDQLR